MASSFSTACQIVLLAFATAPPRINFQNQKLHHLPRVRIKGLSGVADRVGSIPAGFPPLLPATSLPLCRHFPGCGGSNLVGQMQQTDHGSAVAVLPPVKHLVGNGLMLQPQLLVERQEGCHLEELVRMEEVPVHLDGRRTCSRNVTLTASTMVSKSP